jgi:hypothetical protein
VAMAWRKTDFELRIWLITLLLTQVVTGFEKELFQWNKKQRRFPN